MGSMYSNLEPDDFVSAEELEQILDDHGVIDHSEFVDDWPRYRAATSIKVEHVENWLGY
jgi:hypothetical protein